MNDNNSSRSSRSSAVKIQDNRGSTNEHKRKRDDGNGDQARIIEMVVEGYEGNTVEKDDLRERIRTALLQQCSSSDSTDKMENVAFKVAHAAWKAARSKDAADIAALKAAQSKVAAENAALKAAESKAAADIAAFKSREESVRAFHIDRLIDFFDTSDPDILKQREAFKISSTKNASQSSHLNTGRADPHKIIQQEFKVGKITYYKTPNPPMGSNILTSLQGKSECMNESDRQHYVRLILEDAILYVNFVLKTTTKKDEPAIYLVVTSETSLFSNKVDHFAIYGNAASTLPVLSVEVKKEHDKVFTSKSVAGQNFDYIMAAKAIHGKLTFGIITTFTQSKVVWVEDSECDAAAGNSERMVESSLRELAGKVLGRKILDPSSMFSNSGSTEPEPDVTGQSPEQKAMGQLSLSQQSKSPPDLVSAPSSPDREAVRSLRQSQDVYEAYQLFTVFCNAIFASLAISQKKRTIVKDFEWAGKLLAGDTVLCMKTKHGHEWDLLETDVKINGPWEYDSRQTKFHCVEFLGVGDTSRAWRAVAIARPGTEGKQATGKACVVKHWVKVWDRERGERLAPTEVNQESKSSTKREEQHYHKIYPHMKKYVKTLRLNAQNSLVLPFFRPIPKAQREAKLPEIKALLMTKFFRQTRTGKTGTSYRFRVCDMRWCHVGMYFAKEDSGGEIVLFDLADLEVVKATSKDDHEGYVSSHIQALKDRM